MKQILMGLAILFLLFVLLIGVFTVIFLLQSEPGVPADVEELTPTEMRAVIQTRDSLMVQVDSLTALLARLTLVQDSLEQQLAINGITVTDLQNRLQTQNAEIEALREVEVNAKAMARTFATMTVDELTPIVEKLNDRVVLSIYEQTTTKRRKFLLNAMGTERAAALTNNLVKKEEQEGS